MYYKRERFVKGSIFNIANLISFSRACTALPIVYAIRHSHPVVFLWIAFAVFTDWLDGHLARKFDLTSKFGAIIDPIADFVVIASVTTYFTMHGYMSIALWWLMFFRYITICLAALLLVQFTSVQPKSNMFGKCSVCVFSIYGFCILIHVTSIVVNVFLALFVILLIISWVQYLKTYIKPLKSCFNF